MTDTEAIQQIIAGTPHLARYVQDVAEGAKTRDTGYVYRSCAAKARATRAHGPQKLIPAANRWMEMNESRRTWAVVGALDEACQGVPA